MRDGRTMITREEALEILRLAQQQGDYSLGHIIPRAMTTILVLYAQVDSAPKGGVNDGSH